MNIDIDQSSTIDASITYIKHPGRPLIVIEPPEGMGDATRNFSNDVHTLPVIDARTMSQSPLLDREGFTLIEHETSFEDFADSNQIKTHFYPETERLVVKATGARTVQAFDHNIRVAAADDTYRRPAGIVHVDLTERSARRIIAEQLSETDAYSAFEGRIVFINAWMPLINEVHSAHLALCDARTVPASSLHTAELRYANRTGELFYCSFHHSHRWYYFSRMSPNEVLLLKNYDSAENGRARAAPHTAIDDPTVSKNAPARQSIEVRTIAFFE